MTLRWLCITALLVACGPTEKKKSDDPTVIAEDLDQPVDLSLGNGGAFWTTKPAGASFGGSGEPSSLQYVALDGGDVRTLLSGLKQATSPTNDGQRLYWFDQDVGGKAQLNRMDFSGDGRSVLLNFADAGDVPTPDTRLFPFNGRLYWGGVLNLWALPLDGSAPQPLVRARQFGTRLSVVFVDSTGIYFQELNGYRGTDLKHVPLTGAGPGDDPGAWQVPDAGTADAGAPYVTSDGGYDWPEAPGVTLVRRSILSSPSRVALADGFLYWYRNALGFGGDVQRAPFAGGPDERLFGLPSNGSATDIASDGRDVLFLIASNAGGSLNRIDDGQRTQVFQLGLLTSGTPRELRLDDTTAFFFAGGDRGARLHRVWRLRERPDAGAEDAGVDAGP